MRPPSERTKNRVYRNPQRNGRCGNRRPPGRHAGAVSATCGALHLDWAANPKRAARRTPGREAMGVAADRRRRNCSRALCHRDRTQSGRGSRVREKDAKDPTLRDRARAAASKGGHMTIPFENLKARLLANPKVKAGYDALAPEFEIAAELLRARLRAGFSQAELAARMGTSQSTIARLESGQTLPSTKTLLRYAEATGSKFHVRLSAASRPRSGGALVPRGGAEAPDHGAHLLGRLLDQRRVG